MLDSAGILSIVALAQAYLEEVARNDKGPIRFHIRGFCRDGKLVDQPLVADCLYTPPWGWPVLDSHVSAAALSKILATLNGVEFTNLLLAADRPNRRSDVVCDLMDELPKLPKRPQVDMSLQVHGVAEAVTEICAEELGSGECVAVVSADMSSFSQKYDLSAHMMYAQDGSDTILWTGSSAGNGRDPQDVLSAARKEYFHTHRCDMVLVVSGKIVDLGDGRVRLRNPHRLAILDFE